MNWSYFKKNVGRQFQIEPIASFLDDGGNELAEANDDWEIIEISKSEVIRVRNLRTGHEALLGKDHIYDFRTNPNRSDENKQFGFLILKVHIFVKGDEVWLRPNSRPGHRVIPYPSKRQRPEWTEFIKVDAQAGIPVTAKTVKIQYRLWSEYDNVPLMIRIASGAKGKFSQEASGPSGVIDILVTETQTFYVSLSSPNLHFKIGIAGWTY